MFLEELYYMYCNTRPKSAPKGVIVVHVLSHGHGGQDIKSFANNVHCTNIFQAFHNIILFLPNLLRLWKYND
jgi:hypothetical protein